MGLFLWLLASNSWVGDDAFITMRVVDNFVHGYGLVWNVSERVQVFTHPLWLFLIALVYRVVLDPFQTLFFLSYAVSLLMIFLLLRNFARTPQAIILAGFVLATSMAFIDYCSSGLENPLTNLLLVVMLVYVVRPAISLKKLFLTSLLAALAAFNRLDTLLFYLPILAFQFVALRKFWLKASGLILLGFVPLILWEAFATFYFGFPFPNTYYAKLGASDLSGNWLRRQGWGYFLNSFLRDPITLGLIALGFAFVVWERNTRKIAISVGVLLYLVYVYSIGGDFMSGRFFAAPFVVTVALLLTIDYRALVGSSKTKRYGLALAVLTSFGLAAFYPHAFEGTSKSDCASDEFGIADEKLCYFSFNSWTHHSQANTLHDWCLQGIRLRISGDRYAFRENIGMLGYYAGPRVYLVDKYVLTDPLRSRVIARPPFRVGHVERVMPAGYEETLRDHFANQILDPDLHLYYDRLSILIHGDLDAADRWQAILSFNLGRYDESLARYNRAISESSFKSIR